MSRRRQARARDGRRRGAGRVRAVVADWALISGLQLRKNPRQLLLQFAQTAGVVDSVGRPLGLFSLWELTGCPFVQGCMTACTGPLARGPPRRQQRRSWRRSCARAPPRTAAASRPPAPPAATLRGLLARATARPAAPRAATAAARATRAPRRRRTRTAPRPSGPRARPATTEGPQRSTTSVEHLGVLVELDGRPGRRRSWPRRDDPARPVPPTCPRRCRPSGRRTAARSLFFCGGCLGVGVGVEPRPRLRRSTSARRPRPRPRPPALRRPRRELLDVGLVRRRLVALDLLGRRERLDLDLAVLVDRRGGRLGEHVLGQAELRHVLEVAGVVGRAVRRGSTWSSTRLIDSDRRRRSESISRILTFTSSPGWTISRGFSTCCWASSEMCTRPSTPSRISTNAPNATTLVTAPSSSSPTW